MARWLATLPSLLNRVKPTRGSKYKYKLGFSSFIQTFFLFIKHFLIFMMFLVFFFKDKVWRYAGSKFNCVSVTLLAAEPPNHVT